MNQFLLIMHTEHKDLGGRSNFTNAGNDVKAVKLRHRDVQDHQVRLESLRFFDGLASVARLRDDIPLWFFLKQRTQSLAQYDVIVHHENRRSPHVSPAYGFAVWPLSRSIF